jgi:16S rRNA (uracil1498-N3)-methyltransferase
VNSPRRCFIDGDAWTGPEAELSENESHYVRDVLRLRPGDALSAFDGRGRLADALVVAGAGGGRRGSRVAVRLTNLRCLPRRLPSLTLLQAVAKPARMDWIVEKATELGVGSIVPLITEHVVGAERADGSAGRTERWQRIALGAARQCGTPWLPEIGPARSLPDALGAPHAWDVLFVGALTPGARSFRAALTPYRDRMPGRAALLIGPEGDFTAAEIEMAMACGAVPVSFGPLVLRVETAAVFGLSVLLHELGTGPGGE